MSTEKWKPIPGFERHQVSDLGRVMVTKSSGNTKILAIEPKHKTVQLYLPGGHQFTRAKVSALVDMAFDDDDTFDSPLRVYVEAEYPDVPSWLSPKGRGHWKVK
jgi:hypothetical protein